MAWEEGMDYPELDWDPEEGWAYWEMIACLNRAIEWVEEQQFMQEISDATSGEEQDEDDGL